MCVCVSESRSTGERLRIPAEAGKSYSDEPPPC